MGRIYLTNRTRLCFAAFIKHLSLPNGFRLKAKHHASKDEDWRVTFTFTTTFSIALANDSNGERWDFDWIEVPSLQDMVVDLENPATWPRFYRTEFMFKPEDEASSNPAPASPETPMITSPCFVIYCIIGTTNPDADGKVKKVNLTEPKVVYGDSPDFGDTIRNEYLLTPECKQAVATKNINVGTIRCVTFYAANVNVS